MPALMRIEAIGYQERLQGSSLAGSPLSALLTKRALLQGTVSAALGILVERRPPELFYEWSAYLARLWM